MTLQHYTYFIGLVKGWQISVSGVLVR